MKNPWSIIALFAISTTVGVVAGLLINPFTGGLLAGLTFIAVACCQLSSHITQEEERLHGHDPH